jgi:hypothetical protein
MKFRRSKAKARAAAPHLADISAPAGGATEGNRYPQHVDMRYRSPQTHRWSKGDSNSRSRITNRRFRRTTGHGHAGASDRTACGRDQGFESPLLLRGVTCEPELSVSAHHHSRHRVRIGVGGTRAGSGQCRYRVRQCRQDSAAHHNEMVGRSRRARSGRLVVLTFRRSGPDLADTAMRAPIWARSRRRWRADKKQRRRSWPPVGVSAFWISCNQAGLK